MTAAPAPPDIEHQRYAAIVAHDLRGPIRNARLLAERLTLVCEEGSNPQLARDLSARLVDALGRADATILRLLDAVPPGQEADC